MTEQNLKNSAETNNIDWLAYLGTQGAVMQNDAVVSFGDIEPELAATNNGSIICDLSHLGLLEIDGADAFTFLQGQVTNDINLLDGNTSHYTGHCSPKGRLLALFLAFSHYNHLHLQFSRTLVAPIMKRLKMYVMRSKVEIKDASATIIKIGLSSENAVFLLESLFSQVPKTPYELVSLTNGALICLPSGNKTKARYEIFTSAQHAPAIWNTLKQHCTPVGLGCWEILEIEAGIPDVTPKTQEEFVPQMLNLDLMNAINFKKGCYTGQEIVARTHYLGKVKRRTLHAEIDASVLPEAGDDVFNIAQEAVGKVVRCALNEHGKISLLLELRLDNVDSTQLDNTKLTLHGKNIQLLAENSFLFSMSDS